MGFDLHPELIAASQWEKCSLRDIETARAVDAAMVAQVTPSDLPHLRPGAVSVEDVAIPTSRGRGLPLRIYRPVERPPSDVLLLVHGGAFCLGDLDTDHLRCLWYAQEAEVAVVSVGYALAPEHPFPAAAQDCWDALEWVRRVEWTGDATADATARVGLAGVSAGAALAAGVALKARDRGLAGLLSCQLLLFPVTDSRQATRSIAEGSDYPAWDSELTRQMWATYLGHTGSRRPRTPAEALSDFHAAPALADSLAGLPPTLIHTAHFDPLRDEGLRFADRLIQDGVATDLHHFSGTFHVFDTAAPRASIAQVALREQVDFLRRFLDRRLG